MKVRIALGVVLACVAAFHAGAVQDSDTWLVDTAEEWVQATETSTNLSYREGLAIPAKDKAVFRSILKTFDRRRKAKRLVLTQSPAWDNWKPVPNIGPDDTRNAPIFIPIADGNYWFFAESTTLGPGYHAWHSSDMKNWEHKGVAGTFKWATSAEYADGKIYLYFDKPNDQDPHLVIGENLDGTPTWTHMGKVFDDPSHGSDAGVIRIEDGTFHLVYEDWSPINARSHSWDSPLAGHADSPDGINGFEYGDNPPAIDHRTTPTGKYGTYRHSATSKDEPLQYEIHEPGQNAYGDYTLIKVGGRFYIFCDYHPHNQKIRIGYFASDSINNPFEFVGSLGEGHPDPTIGFAEGQFYLIIQCGKTDYVSPGPWVDTVEARAGVDTDGDGRIDQWTDWQKVTERYHRKPGFARLVDATPAHLDLSSLPAGRGFRFAFRTEDTTGNESYPIIDHVKMLFE